MEFYLNKCMHIYLKLTVTSSLNSSLIIAKMSEQENVTNQLSLIPVLLGRTCWDRPHASLLQLSQTNCHYVSPVNYFTFVMIVGSMNNY